MCRPLVVGPRGDCLQDMESSRTRVAAETSGCIVAPLDCPQVIELSSPWVVAGKPQGIEVSSYSAIRLSSSGRTIFVIKVLSKCGISFQCQRTCPSILNPSKLFIDRLWCRMLSTSSRKTINFAHSRQVDYSLGSMIRPAPHESSRRQTN